MDSSNNDQATDDEQPALEAIETLSSEAYTIETLTTLLMQRNSKSGLFRSPLSYHESCALVGCNLPREKSVSDNNHYCCLGHKTLSSSWSSKSTAFHVYDGLNDTKKQRDEVCCSAILLKADNIDVGISTLDASRFFTKVPWENEDVICTALRDQESSRDYLFFTTPPRAYTTLDSIQDINWRLNARLHRPINGQVIDITLLTLTKGKKGRKINGWRLYLYQYREISLYCLSREVEGVVHLKLPPKTPHQKRHKPDDGDGKGTGEGKGKDSPRVNPNSKTEKTKPPMTQRQGRGKDIVVSGNTMSKYSSFLDDFVLDKFMQGFIRPVSTVFFSDVCGSTLDCHHRFVAEYGTSRDVNFGFHETINGGDTVESFRSVISVSSSPGVFVSEMLRPRLCEMMLSKVEKFGEGNTSSTKSPMPQPQALALKRDLSTTFFEENFKSIIFESSPGVFVFEMPSEVGNFRERVNGIKLQEIFDDSHKSDQVVLRNSARATTCGHWANEILLSTSFEGLISRLFGYEDFSSIGDGGGIAHQEIRDQVRT
ncbi:hypothetical protein ISN44_As06g039150 [Arabidopsis suecica]|uniref:Uncharacterized protein n=1 Tax=Arabidopsis suecica TaxID=45249 RepID=A0A8T2CH78_ARASU|nr:hypothetical protein ISN44_As06g039150 [Arabidopsis suecica]